MAIADALRVEIHLDLREPPPLNAFEIRQRRGERRTDIVPRIRALDRVSTSWWTPERHNDTRSCTTCNASGTGRYFSSDV
jgi:hypothetical protein